jgi:hypothetical protein
MTKATEQEPVATQMNLVLNWSNELLPRTVAGARLNAGTRFGPLDCKSRQPYVDSAAPLCDKSQRR